MSWNWNKLITFRAFFSLRLCLALLTGSSSISAAAASYRRQNIHPNSMSISTCKLCLNMNFNGSHSFWQFLFSGQKGWLQEAQKNESHCVNHHWRVKKTKNICSKCLILAADVVVIFSVSVPVNTIFQISVNSHLSLLCLCLGRVLFLQLRDWVVTVGLSAGSYRKHQQKPKVSLVTPTCLYMFSSWKKDALILGKSKQVGQ